MISPGKNKKTSEKNITGAVSSSVAAAGSLSSSSKVQQAAALAGGISAIAGGIKGANGNGNSNIPFDQLDTPTATKVAMAGAKAAKSDDLSAAIGEMMVPNIGVGVHINDKAITEILSVNITQDIAGHNELKMRFYQDQAQAEGSLTFEGAEKLLGQVTEVEFYDKNGVSDGRLQNLFVIADVQFEQQALNEGIITVTGYAPTWILDGEPHFETFYKKSLSTIAKSVAKSLPQVKASIKADPTITDTLPFVCRYNESAWNFLKRLSAETGQWLYFNGKELVFGKPEAKQGPKIIYGHNCYNINMSLRARPVQQSLFDYEADEDRSIKTAANNYNGNAGMYNLIAFNKSRELFGSTPAVASPAFLPSKENTLQAIGKSKGQQSVAGMYYVTGETTVHELRVGMNADVELKRGGQTASHAPVRITRIEHYIDASGQYSNKFEAIPAAAEAPPVTAYQKPYTFPMLAQVIDNKDSKGRVRVKFLGWQQEGLPETDFIRVLTPDAGGGGDKVAQNRGLVTIPEVGDQVYVDFEQGNPDRPFVTGSVFHGKHGKGGGGGNNGKSLTSKSGHTVNLDDGGGITIKDKSGGNHIVVDGTNKVTVTSSQTVELTNGTSSIKIDSNKITIYADEIEIAKEGGDSSKIEIKGLTTTVFGKNEMKMLSDAMAEVNSKGTADFIAQATATLKSKMTTVKADTISSIEGPAGVNLNCT